MERLRHELKEAGVPPRHEEGRRESGWVLIDFGDVIVHVFSPEKRDYYRLEELWGRTTPVVRFTGEGRPGLVEPDEADQLPDRFPVTVPTGADAVIRLSDRVACGPGR